MGNSLLLLIWGVGVALAFSHSIPFSMFNGALNFIRLCIVFSLEIPKSGGGFTPAHTYTHTQ